MGSASSSVATFSVSNLSYIKNGKRKNNEKEIISSILTPHSSSSKKISPNNQNNNKSSPSKYKAIHNNDPNQTLNNEDGDTQTLPQRKISTKLWQHNSKKDVISKEEIKEKSNQDILDEYNDHILPLIIGDTVHILEENGEGM